MTTLQEAIEQTNKKYGALSVLSLADAPRIPVDVISTGSLALDLALGVGGLPRGRTTEIYGPESAGKTTLCQHIVASAQQAGLTVLYIDMEQAVDPPYMERCGVDMSTLLFSQPDTGDQALGIAEAMAASGTVGLIVVDSIAALVPRVEAEDSDMGDSVMGVQARLMSQAMRKLSPVIKRTNTAMVFTNQLRFKIGPAAAYGNPETTPGGDAMKYYAAVRLDIRRKEFLKNGQDTVGIRAKVKIVKNKVAPPYKVAEFNIRYPNGISLNEDLLEAALQAEIVSQRGSYYYMGEEKLGQGRESAAEAVAPIRKELTEKILQTLR